jgi:hypothetical protein
MKRYSLCFSAVLLALSLTACQDKTAATNDKTASAEVPAAAVSAASDWVNYMSMDNRIAQEQQAKTEALIASLRAKEGKEKEATLQAEFQKADSALQAEALEKRKAIVVKTPLVKAVQDKALELNQANIAWRKLSQTELKAQEKTIQTQLSQLTQAVSALSEAAQAEATRSLATLPAPTTQADDLVRYRILSLDAQNEFRKKMEKLSAEIKSITDKEKQMAKIDSDALPLQVELEKKMAAIPTNTPAVKALQAAEVEFAQLNIKFLQLKPAERQIQGQAINKQAQDLMIKIKTLGNAAEGYTPPVVEITSPASASAPEASK